MKRVVNIPVWSGSGALVKRLLDLGQSDVHVDSSPTRSTMKTLEELKKALEAGDISQEEFEAKKKLLDAGGGAVECGEGNTPAPPPAAPGGSAEMTAHGDGVVIEMKSAEKAEPVWIQIAKQGEFRGHAAGKFRMDAGTFTQIIANFNAQSNQFIPVDFEHASEQHPTEGSIPYSGAPAQGWITKLELRNDGNLWGLVTWGELARGYIKKGQYKFLSPAIVFGAKDRVTGKPCGARLSSVALTNNPFLDGMMPVAAKRTELLTTMPPASLSTAAFTAVREALELPSYMDAAHVLVSINMTAGGATGQKDADERATKVRDALRLPLTASNEEVFNAARVACGAITPPAPLPVVTEKPATAEGTMNMAGENKDKDTEISSLTVKLGAAEAKVTTLTSEHTIALKAVTDENAALKLRIEEFETKEITALVDGALSVWGEKKGLTAESRPHLMRMAKNDREGFVALFPPPVKGSPAQPHHGKLVAAGAHAVAPNTTPAGEGAQIFNIADAAKDVPSVDDIANKLILDAKNAGSMMTREEAYGRAFTERQRLVKAAAQKAFAGNGG